MKVVFPVGEIVFESAGTHVEVGRAGAGLTDPRRRRLEGG